MRLENSNKRYSNIIAGILVAVLVSIFVAFALGMGDFKTNLPHYISPSGVEFPYDAENEVSKINILGNNADVSVAKDWEEEADPYGTTILIVPDTVWWYDECGQVPIYFSDMPDYFPLFGADPSAIPNIIEECGLEDYYFTIAVFGCYDPDSALINFDQCGQIYETIHFDKTEITDTWRLKNSDMLTWLTGISGHTTLEGWQFYVFDDLECENEMIFCDDVEVIDPYPDSGMPTPVVAMVDITINVTFTTEGCGLPFTLILSQK